MDFDDWIVSHSETMCPWHVILSQDPTWWKMDERQNKHLKKNLITRGYTPLYKQPFFQRFSRVFLDKKIPIIEFPYSRCHSKREMVLCFFGRPWLGKVQLVSWWLSHPIEKYWSSWIMSPLSRWEQTKWNNNQVKMHVVRWPFLQAQFDKSMWRLQKSGSSRSQSQIPGNFELPTMNYRFSAW